MSKRRKPDSKLSQSSSSVKRHTSSLINLSNKFLISVAEAPNHSVELTELCSTLSMQKRRIYDILNVLAAVGVVEKSGKNTVEYIESLDNSPLANLIPSKNSSVLQMRKKQLEQYETRSIRMSNFLKALETEFGELSD